MHEPDRNFALYYDASISRKFRFFSKNLGSWLAHLSTGLAIGFHDRSRLTDDCCYDITILKSSIADSAGTVQPACRRPRLHDLMCHLKSSKCVQLCGNFEWQCGELDGFLLKTDQFVVCAAH